MGVEHMKDANAAKGAIPIRIPSKPCFIPLFQSPTNVFLMFKPKNKVFFKVLGNFNYKESLLYRK